MKTTREPQSENGGRALIAPDENRRMFDTIARRYDLLNRIISLGLDRSWRRKAVDHLRVEQGGRYVDAGCGTGALCVEIAGRFAPGGQQFSSWKSSGPVGPAVPGKCSNSTAGATNPLRFTRRASAIIPMAPGGVTVTGLDFSEAMLREGEKRIRARGVAASVSLLSGNALALPFAESSVDGVISGFVLRNIDDRRGALAEWFRVLRPGGRCVVLELAMPERPVARWAYRLFTRLLVPAAGALLSRHKAYVYLIDSIRAFPPAETVLALFHDAGFADVQSVPLTFGAVRIYHGTKPFA